MYYILNDSFVPIMPFENYVSFLWTDRFFEAGDFEIETMPETALLEQCKQDYYILNTESEHEMIIEGLKITTGASGDTAFFKKHSNINGFRTPEQRNYLYSALLKPSISAAIARFISR